MMIKCDLGGDLMEQMWCTCGNPLRGSRDAIHQKPLRFPFSKCSSRPHQKNARRGFNSRTRCSVVTGGFDLKKNIPNIYAAQLMLIVKILNFTDSSLLRVLQEKTRKIGAQIFTRESKGPDKSDKLVGHILTHSQMALEPP